jgi:hypothetical protein
MKVARLNLQLEYPEQNHNTEVNFVFGNPEEPGNGKIKTEGDDLFASEMDLVNRIVRGIKSHVSQANHRG